MPEPHVSLVGAATVLQVLAPKPRKTGRLSTIFGLALIAVGGGLAVAATRAAGSVDMARPERVITDGVYARSRHPMYVSWTLIYAGTTVVTGNRWLMLLSPILVGLVHLETGTEERMLRSVFGSEYDKYRARVPRYL